MKMHRYNYAIHPKVLAGNLSRPGQLHVYHRQRQPEPTCKLTFLFKTIMVDLNSFNTNDLLIMANLNSHFEFQQNSSYSSRKQIFKEIFLSYRNLYVDFTH